MAEAAEHQTSAINKTSITISAESQSVWERWPLERPRRGGGKSYDLEHPRKVLGNGGKIR